MSDADEIVQAELADEPLEVRQPPLSISHLLLWILGSAVVLGSYRWLAEPVGDDETRRLLYQLDQLARSLTYGAGAAALLIFARRLIARDAPLPRHPGHWLLLIQGINWPAYWLLLLSYFGLRGMPQDAPRDWESIRRFALASMLYYLWTAGLYAAVLAFLRDAKRWRMFFAVGAALPLVHAVIWCCMFGGYQSLIERSFIMVRIAVALAILTVCILRDRREGVRRDWLHVAGVSFYILGVFTYLAIYLLLIFLPRAS
ncbi:MAG TPA: hypothetical protein VMP01_04245 [Pirellulaceae bacterium]|nr:hypothetical protein [Pirellulaceae bacterium]